MTSRGQENVRQVTGRPNQMTRGQRSSNTTWPWDIFHLSQLYPNNPSSHLNSAVVCVRRPSLPVHLFAASLATTVSSFIRCITSGSHSLYFSSSADNSACSSLHLFKLLKILLDYPVNTIANTSTCVDRTNIDEI